MKSYIFFSIFLFLPIYSFCQKGVITGELIDFSTNTPIKKAPILIYGTPLGTVSDSAGKFKINISRYQSTELIVSGQPYWGTKLEAGENNYYTLFLRNIKIDKQNRVVDLGIIYMINIGNEELFKKLPCKKVLNKSYFYEMVDGAERNTEGKIGLIDFAKSYESCIKE